MKDLMKIHPQDNVAVCLAPMGGVPAGHKIALCPIPQGGAVVKYGHRIGLATRDIAPGEWVHTHNLRSALTGRANYVYRPHPCPLPAQAPRTFRGFVRPDGSVGVRNEIWVLPTVGCVGKVAESLVRQARRLAHGSVGEVLAFPHPYGCSQLGEDQENTRRLLAALACHPNAGGVLLLGLGCENSGVEEILSRMDRVDPSRVKTLVCQRVEDEMAEGLALLRQLIDGAAGDARQEVPASRLIAGLKCGGSDGFSGLTANPVIGGFSDRLIALGGTTLLTEVPEMFGAEDLLMDRCASEAVFLDAVRLINSCKDVFTAAGQPVYENPSPGNKAGGITTLEEKSLGCTQKSGGAAVRGVLSYAQRVQSPGLYLLNAPGNDLVASTALAAAGAQIVLFSTGRGTPFACPAPTMKIASNSALARQKDGWIDFDAGGALADGAPDRTADALMDAVLAVASGRAVKSEQAGLQDMAILKSGVTL